MVEETNKALYEITKIMSSVMSNINISVQRDMLEKSFKAKQAIVTANYKYSNDPTHSSLVNNIKSMTIAGVYVAKDYLSVEIMHRLGVPMPSLDTFISYLDPHHSLTREFIAAIPLYIQMASLAYIIPIIFNKINFRILYTSEINIINY